MQKNQIIESVDKTVAKVNEMFPNLNFKKPTVEFFSRGKVAGRAYYAKHHLEFNEVLAMENAEEFENTVIHEVAHLVVRKVYPFAKQAHGPEFRAVCRHLGGTGNTYHSYDVSTVARTMTKVVYECGCREHKIPPQKHRKIQMGVSYYCRTCKGEISAVKVNGKVKVVKQA